jgi:peptide/nickel transport system permease protein
LYGLTVIFGIVTLLFVLFNILPSDPAVLTQGQRSDVQTIENVRKELGLDQPLPIQYAYYLNDLSFISLHQSKNLHKYSYFKVFSIGNTSLVFKAPYLRRSFQTQKEVTEMIASVLPNTIVLAIAAMAIAIFLGLSGGFICVWKQDSWLDKFLVNFSILGMSMPSFFSAILIAWLFGYVLSHITGLNMTGSLFEYDVFEGRVLNIRNLILPAFTLGIRPLAVILQITRSSILDVMEHEYVKTALSKGLPKWKIYLKHVFRSALNPIITSVSGWMASLLAGAFFVEYIFGYNGLGKLTVDALALSDLPVIMGGVISIAIIFVLINMLVDVIYAKLDPRISYK